jgi:hypothetical protein
MKVQKTSNQTLRHLQWSTITVSDILVRLFLKLLKSVLDVALDSKGYSTHARTSSEQTIHPPTPKFQFPSLKRMIMSNLCTRRR